MKRAIPKAKSGLFQLNDMHLDRLSDTDNSDSDKDESIFDHLKQKAQGKKSLFMAPEKKNAPKRKECSSKSLGSSQRKFSLNSLTASSQASTKMESSLLSCGLSTISEMSCENLLDLSNQDITAQSTAHPKRKTLGTGKLLKAKKFVADPIVEEEGDDFSDFLFPNLKPVGSSQFLEDRSGKAAQGIDVQVEVSLEKVLPCHPKKKSIRSNLKQSDDFHIDDSILDQLLEPEVALPKNSAGLPSFEQPHQADSSSQQATPSTEDKDQKMSASTPQPVQEAQALDEEEITDMVDKWMELSENYYKSGRGSLRVNTWTHYKMVAIERKLEEVLEGKYRLVELKKRFADRLAELKELH